MAQAFTYRIEHFTGLDEDADVRADRVPGASPDMLNFRVTAKGELVRRDGCETVFTFPDTLRGIWCGKLGGDLLFTAVSGGVLYASGEGFDRLSPVAGAVPGDREIRFVPFLGKLYLLTGDGILVFDGETLAPLTPYEPTLATATAPNGDGTPLEDVNALTDRVKQVFVPDGTSVLYRLCVRNIESIDRVEVGGEELPPNAWVWDFMAEAVQFARPPEREANEVVIHFRVTGYDPALARRILNCRCAAAFGGSNDTRLFLYGCDEAPDVRFHSGMAGGVPDPAYVPATHYTRIGDGSPVTALLRHYDRQLIFTEKAAYYSYLSYETEADGRTRAVFPVLPLSDDRGNQAPYQALLMENEPVTLTEAGLFRWVSTNVRDERNARLFSQPVRSLLAGISPRSARLFNRKAQGELLLYAGSDIVAYRYGTGAFYRHRVEGVSIRCMAEWEGVLYFGTDSAVCRVGGGTDLGIPFPAYWTTPFLTLGAPEREKNLYAAALCADTTEGGADCDFCFVTPEGESSGGAAASFSAGSRARVRAFPARHCHFERVQARLTERGAGKLHVRYLSLAGKICDKHT